MKKLRPQQHFYPIIDLLVAEAVSEIESGKKRISCRAGCSHCCYLLVEISWAEAVELAHWVIEQEEPHRTQLIARVKANAEEARTVFEKSKKDARYGAPVFDDEAELSQKSYDRYFFDQSRPCPFLENDRCTAYAVRPSACRMHVVTSPPILCSREVKDEKGYELPKRLEQLREEVGPINSVINQGQAWGHLAVMVESALSHLT